MISGRMHYETRASIFFNPALHRLHMVHGTHLGTQRCVNCVGMKVSGGGGGGPRKQTKKTIGTW